MAGSDWRGGLSGGRGKDRGCHVGVGAEGRVPRGVRWGTDGCGASRPYASEGAGRKGGGSTWHAIDGSGGDTWTRSTRAGDHVAGLVLPPWAGERGVRDRSAQRDLHRKPRRTGTVTTSYEHHGSSATPCSNPRLSRQEPEASRHGRKPREATHRDERRCAADGCGCSDQERMLSLADIDGVLPSAKDLHG